MYDEQNYAFLIPAVLNTAPTASTLAALTDEEDMCGVWEKEEFRCDFNLCSRCKKTAYCSPHLSCHLHPTC